MSQYTYFAYDMRTGILMDELRLGGVSFASTLNGYGDMDATVSMAVGQRPADLVATLAEARTCIFALRDGIPLWGGILWQTDWSGNKFTIRASEYGSYWDSRAIKRDQNGLTSGVGDKDIFLHAKDYYDDLHGTTAYGKMMLQAGAWYGTTCGKTSQVTLEARNRQWYFDALQHLSRIEDGLDFAFDVRTGTSGAPEFVLNLAYPWRGQTVATTPILFDRSKSGRSNILSYTWPRDGFALATTYDAVGDVSIKSYTNSSLLAAGYPLLDQVDTYSGTTVDSTLQAHANAGGKLRAMPAVVPTLVVRADIDPVLGSYITGDVCRIDIEDARFPAGLSVYARILAIKPRPSSRGRGETVELLLDQVAAA